jgi:hypothetical protein
MTSATYRWEHQPAFLIMLDVALAVVCFSSGMLELRGQDANSASAGAPAAQQGGQPGQQPAIKSDVRIVLVDVVVTGAKGFFEEHTGGKVTPVALPEMPRMCLRIIRR